MATHTVTVEIYYGGSWHDITSSTFIDPMLTIKRYGASMTRKLDPGSVTLSVNNADGSLNPENPVSPLYGVAGRNTPIRITVDSVVRWIGKAAEWMMSRPLGGVRRTTIDAGGRLRQLGTGKTPVMSALTAASLSLLPVVYLPLTDGPYATSFGSIVPLQARSQAAGVKFGEVDGPPGDPRKLPQFATDGIGGAESYLVEIPETNVQWTANVSFRAERLLGGANIANLVTLTVGETGSSEEISVWIYGYWSGAEGFPDEVYLLAYSPRSLYGVIDINVDTVTVFDGNWHHVQVAATRSGSTTTLTLTVDGTEDASDTETYPNAGVTAMRILVSTKDDVGSVSMGHITVSNTAWSTYTAMLGNPGDLAAERFEQICSDAGIAYNTIGTPSTHSALMGPQPTAPLLDVLTDAITTDGGILYETMDTDELTFVCLGALCNQSPVLTVDVDTDIAPPLGGVVGTRLARNDVTATRPSGSSARYEITSGPMSTQNPPDGIGRQDTSISPNPESDDKLIDYASWLANGTSLAGVTYERIVLDLDANPSLDVSDVEIGTVIQLDNLPVIDDPYPDPRLLVVGMEETVTNRRRLLTLLVTSAIPYDIGVYDGSTTRYATDGSTLAASVDDDDTSWSLASSGTRWITSAEDAGSFPFQLWAAGEVVTVTAITGTSSPQTATVTRSVNGVVKSHASGTSVQIHRPMHYYLGGQT